MDTGPIVATSFHPLDGTETTPELERALAAEAADLLDASLRKWLSREMTLHPQDEDEATTTRLLRREDGRLDPRRTAVELERQVRAYQPWPGSFVDTSLGRIVVWRAEPAEAGPPMGILDAEGLGTGDGGRLRLLEVQPAGGKRMTWAEYVRGHPAIVGASIVA